MGIGYELGLGLGPVCELDVGGRFTSQTDVAREDDQALA